MAGSNVSTAAGGQESTKQRVKEQGSQVAHEAGNTGQTLVRDTAAQGKQVAQEAGRQARGLVDQARAELMGQAGDQQKRAAGGLRTISDQLRSMADNCGQKDTTTDLVHQASDRVQRVAAWLEQREPGQVVDELRQLARRHPGAFLTGATLAGVLAGRLTRNMASQAGMGRQSDMGMQAEGQAEVPEFGAATQPDTPVPPRAAQAEGART